jgi:hypothetical protein
MKIYSYLFLFLSLASGAYSQKSDWACSGHEVHLTWNYYSLDKKNNLVVGGHFTPTSYSPYSKIRHPTLFDSKGQPVMERMPSDREIIIAYAPDGTVNWKLQLRNFSLCGIANDKNGNTLLLLDAKESGEDSTGKPLAGFSEFEKEPEAATVRFKVLFKYPYI